MNVKLFAAFFLVIIGMLLELLIGDSTGVWLNFALAALIALSFFCTFFEILFLTLFVLLVLNWQPGISLELIVFGAIPVGSFFLRKFIPLEPWAENMFFTCAGIILFYSLFGIHIIGHYPALFLGDLAASLLYSVGVFRAMSLSFPAENNVLDF